LTDEFVMKIIDAVVGLRTPEVVQSFPDVWFQQPSSAKESIGLDSEIATKGASLEEVVNQMDKAGVTKGLLHAPHMGPWGFRVRPEAVAAAVNKYPDRLVPGAIGVDPHKGMTSVRELEGCVKEYGFKSLHFFPHWLGRPANDAIYYPFYAKCVELGIPVFIQIRMPTQPFLRSHGRPEYIEEVAAYFPELKIIGLHLGWPWLQEFMALLIKHPNLYMTTSGYPTRDWDEPFRRFVSAEGQDKIIFGSATPMTRGGIQEALNGIDGHGLDENIKSKILWENAAKVFEL